MVVVTIDNRDYPKYHNPSEWIIHYHFKHTGIYGDFDIQVNAFFVTKCNNTGDFFNRTILMCSI